MCIAYCNPPRVRASCEETRDNNFASRTTGTKSLSNRGRTSARSLSVVPMIDSSSRSHTCSQLSFFKKSKPDVSNIWKKHRCSVQQEYRGAEIRKSSMARLEPLNSITCNYYLYLRTVWTTRSAVKDMNFSFPISHRTTAPRVF